MSRRGYLMLTWLLVLAFVPMIGCSEKKEQKTPEVETQRFLPPPPVETKLPDLPFTDVTEASGVRFTHETGAFRTEKGESRYLPECMGGGVVVFDPDGDGDSDLFFVNSGWFPGHRKPGAEPTCSAWQNDGTGKFRDCSEEWGLALQGYGMGGAAADYDGDGDPDLLVTTWGGPRLFQNRGKAGFAEVTDEAGLRSSGWVDGEVRGPDWSTGAAFFDADQDGDLDLFVCNYVRWTPATDIHFSFDGRFKSFTVPDRYAGNSCRFYRNEGDGRFADVTEKAGVFNDDGKSLGVTLWDFDDDGLLDVVVANDQAPNFLYRNLGGCRFEEVGLDAGIAYDENGKVRAGMGIDTGSYRNDGVPGIPIGNFSREPVSLFRRESKLLFRDVTHQSGVAAPSYMGLTFGLLFADLDLDGWQDLVLVNGHLEPRVQEIWSEIPYAQLPLLLRNQGDGNFARWNDAAGAPFAAPMVGRGLSKADLDGDGDLDLVVVQNGREARILRNDRTGPRGVRVRLVGKGMNREAIGALVELKSDGRVQQRLVKTGSSYLSQSELVQTFGIGAGKIESLRVRWPDGRWSELEAPAVPESGLLVIEQP